MVLLNGCVHSGTLGREAGAHDVGSTQDEPDGSLVHLHAWEHEWVWRARQTRNNREDKVQKLNSVTNVGHVLVHENYQGSSDKSISNGSPSCQMKSISPSTPYEKVKHLLHV